MKFTEILKEWMDSREEYLKCCNESWAQEEYLDKLLATMQRAEDEVNGTIERLEANCNAYKETGFIITNAETAGDPLSWSSSDIPTATPRQKLVLDCETLREHYYNNNMTDITDLMAEELKTLQERLIALRDEVDAILEAR
jgi:hypothetical protein